MAEVYQAVLVRLVFAIVTEESFFGHLKHTGQFLEGVTQFAVGVDAPYFLDGCASDKVGGRHLANVDHEIERHRVAAILLHGQQTGLQAVAAVVTAGVVADDHCIMGGTEAVHLLGELFCEAHVRANEHAHLACLQRGQLVPCLVAAHHAVGRQLLHREVAAVGGHDVDVHGTSTIAPQFQHGFVGLHHHEVAVAVILHHGEFHRKVGNVVWQAAAVYVLRYQLTDAVGTLMGSDGQHGQLAVISLRQSRDIIA